MDSGRQAEYDRELGLLDIREAEHSKVQEVRSSSKGGCSAGVQHINDRGKQPS
jgi:hypothetical protein